MPLYSYSRPGKREWLMQMAWLCSTRATCQRGRAGCVLTDSNGIILSTGYNGINGHGDGRHCVDFPCSGQCEAVHAEKNAIMHLSRGLRERVAMAFVTCSPCVDCAEELILLPNLSAVYYDHVHHRSAKAALGLSALDCAGISNEVVFVGDPFPEHALPVT